MAVVITHNKVATLPDESGAEVNKAEWNDAHAVAGLGTFATQDFATPPAIGGTTPAAGAFTTVTAGTGAATTPSHTIAGATGLGFFSGGGGFLGLSSSNGILSHAGATVISALTSQQMQLGSSQAYTFTSGVVTGTVDNAIGRAGANSLIFGSAVAGLTTTSRTEPNRSTTSIADATPTTVNTITVPNAAHTASYLVHAVVALGAGGAVGTNEAANSLLGLVTVTRTPGANAVATYVQLGTTGSTAVAGAATCAIVGALGAVVGAVGATNTIPFQLTVTKGGGSSTNHVAQTHITLINMNATGITVG